MGSDTYSHMEGFMGIAPRRLRAHARASSAALAATAIAAGAALAPASAGASSADAHAARTLSLKEGASLRKHDSHGFLIKEQGSFKGTLSGPIYIQLKVASKRVVTATIQMYPGGGLLRASASATYSVRTSSRASFVGTLTITGGSGRYSKAHGSGLAFSGTIARSNDAVSVSVSGRMSY